MVRTFHRRFTFMSFTSAFVCAVATLWLFWTPSYIRIVLGLVMAVLFVLITERIANTKYVFTDEGRLLILTGRFTTIKEINVSEITRVDKFTDKLLRPGYLLLHYGDGHMVAVSPENDAAFVAELNKRQK